LRVVILRSNPVSPDPRVERTASILTSAGHAVTVLAWDRQAESPLLERRPYATIKRFRIRARYGTGAGNLLQLMHWQLSLLLGLLSTRTGYDAIHACDFDTIMPALMAGSLLGKPVVYDIFDFYAQSIRNVPAWIARMAGRLDLWLMSRPAAVIVADESRLAQIAGSKPRRVVVVYNTPPDVLHELRGQAGVAREASGLKLAYVGILQKDRGLTEVMRILAGHPAWSMELAGFGGDEPEILEHAARVPGVAFHGRVDYATALKLSYAADALVALYDPAVANNRYSSPNKVFEAMMLGKPIVVSRSTSMDELVAKTGMGLVVDYGDMGAIERCLRQLADAPELRARLGQNARRAYEREYSYEVIRERLVDLYRSLQR